MNRVGAIACIFVLWSSTAWGATLTWTANSESDLAGYRVYQCSQQPCTQSSGKASLLVTLGTTTSFNIGTPTVTQYYFVTAYDSANNESGASGLATFTPAGAPPPVALPAIEASPTSLSFAATQSGANPATQTLSISNKGGGTLSWTASDIATWLTLSPASGTDNGLVTVRVVTGTTAAGTYNDSITLRATGVSSVTVPVTLTVTTTPVPPPPPLPAAPPSPGGLHFTAVE
jgi:hypothetical protein